MKNQDNANKIIIKVQMEGRNEPSTSTSNFQTEGNIMGTERQISSAELNYPETSTITTLAVNDEDEIRYADEESSRSRSGGEFHTQTDNIMHSHDHEERENVLITSKGKVTLKEGKATDCMRLQELSVFYNKDFNAKIIVFGDCNAGKTALIKRFLIGEFLKTYKTTVGVDFYAKTLQWGSHTRINVNFWDLNGDRSQTWNIRGACRNVDAALVVYDTTRPETLNRETHQWIEDVKKALDEYDSTYVPFILIANKCDLPNSKVNINDISSFCYYNNLDGWFVTSAKDDIEIETSMTFTIRSAIQVVMEEKREYNRGCNLNQKKHKQLCF